MSIFTRLGYFFKDLKSLLILNVRLISGMWRLTKLPHPIVTVFGGSRITPDSPYARKAQYLTKMLAAEGYSIVTGGGPGIMEAANKGAMDHLRECHLGDWECPPILSAGIGLVRLNKEKANPFVQENIIEEYFFARKWLLVRYSTAFVIFPGGFGTLDELFEIVTLAQTDHMQKAPIILMESHYWQPIIDWAETRALKENLITLEDIKLIQVVDDSETAFEIINKSFIRKKNGNLDHQM
ncbi:MAG: TIGR00730 family Rossman fold protein [bacterium]